jgi:hypothetical protein
MVTVIAMVTVPYIPEEEKMYTIFKVLAGRR